MSKRSTETQRALDVDKIELCIFGKGTAEHIVDADLAHHYGEVVETNAAGCKGLVWVRADVTSVLLCGYRGLTIQHARLAGEGFYPWGNVRNVSWTEGDVLR
jgi:hypothetical protein